MTNTRNYLYKIILLFALADFALGIVSMFIAELGVQLSALIVTSVTLALSLTFAIKYPRKKRADIVMVVVGSLDLVTTLISVLVIVLATQLLAVLASGFTLLKAVKIFVQSEKAKSIIGTTKPILLKLAQRFAPAIGAWLVSKYQYIKQKLEGDKVMEKIKKFFVALGNLIRANKISLGETVVNGGVCGFLGYLVNETGFGAINVNGFNITPLLSIIVFVVGELGMFWEKYPDFINRVLPKLQEKEDKKALKEAERKQKEAEQERARILAAIEAEKNAKALAEQAEAERLEKEKAEAEAKAKKEQEDREIAEWLAKKQAEESKQNIVQG